jgi:hypothetical protein
MEQSTDSRSVSRATVGECWLASIAHVLEYGRPHHDEDVDLLEVLGLCVHVTRPHWRDPIIDEFGDPDIVSRTLLKFSKGVCMPERPFTYGERIFNLGGIDQFEWMVDRLKAKRETKSATVCLLIPGSRDRNQPCLTTVDAKIRSDRLELQFFFRSQNILGRQYANLLALARMQADLADRCSVMVGALQGYVASAHIYAFDLPVAKALLAGRARRVRDDYYRYGPGSIRSG